MEPGILEIGGVSIAKGERRTIELEVANLYTHSQVTMPIHVIRGKRDGPTLFISAAIHGDELNGIEIVRRLLTLPTLKNLRGTLIAVPIVNVQGFLAHTRYLPDRRDLNRCFPGSEKGSMGGRLANLFANEIVMKSDCGIDLHTGAIHRSNLPQIRANLDDPRVQKLADAFGTPLMLNAELRDGSLREYAAGHNVPILVYEAGEALRFDETCITTGLKGVVNVMRSLGMISGKAGKRKKPPILARSSNWLRAEQSGIFRATSGLGDRVAKGEVMGFISDPLGGGETSCIAQFAGVIIGRLNLPLVNEGDAIFHVAKFGNSGAVEELVGEMNLHTDDLSDSAPIL
jgi:predicted deacylase